ncbi:DMT family transporter [Pseudoprimorskyibacter insulae]|uniref:Riboflavin transporter n=1 Tax=Pseudoprimorskyibacter insulae TaxID=1695997 RepID=A0A2R8ANL3_9RHOB|nr:DMT family transporter [Pseudoprimorskyibacter insulae]SPF77487.1 Riboflavin transporter [Pseudoprimorskyibacter insulae]
MTANLRGSLFMILAMGLFAVEDMLFKFATLTAPVGPSVIVFALIGLVCFGAMCAFRGQAILPAAAFDRTMLIRTVCEVTARAFFALSLLLAPLTTTTAILQATPLVVVLAAAVLLKTPVSRRQWVGLILGFGGVLLILRPAPSLFDATAILAIVATLGFAGRDLATRLSSASLSGQQLGVLGFGALLIGGVMLTALNPAEAAVPQGPALVYLLGTGLFGVLAYSSLTMAMRTGDIPKVTPFRYTRLLFATALAMAIFGERPDLTTLIGGAIVVASGLYALVPPSRRV